MYGLLLTAFFMLFTSPELISDIGFQLSIMSTIGILTIQPLLPKNELFSDFSTTIAAQIATLPIILANFGQYGLLSMLVNFLVLWTIPPLMIVGGVGSIIGLVFQSFGKVIIEITIPLLWFFESIVTSLGSLGWNVSVKSFSPFLIVGYYCLLIAFILFIHQRQKKIE